MIAARAMLKAAAAAGMSFVVDGGGETPDYQGPSWTLAWDACKAVEIAVVTLWRPERVIAGWAQIIADGVDPEETLADYSGGWIEAWWQENME